MNSNVSNLSKNCVLKYRINKFKSLGLLDLHEPRYGDIEKVLRNKDTIKITNNLLNSLLNISNNNNPRVFLSIFMFTSFPDMINFHPETSDTDSIEFNLLTFSKDLIRQLNKIAESDNYFYTRVLITRFQYLYEVMSNLFFEFKKRDRLGLIEGLIVSYSEVEQFAETLDKNKELDETTLEHIEIEKKKIMRRLEQLDGVKLFNEVREKKQRVIERITSSVKENMEKAYWDSIKSKMEASPPDYTVIIPLLKQIIIYIDSALEYNKKYVSDVIETIDLDFLNQKIENADVSKFDIHDIIEYILDTFIELEPRVRLDNNKKYKEDKLGKLMSMQESELPKFLIYFFKEMFKRFENLVTETVEYRKMPLISDIINKKKA
tara:strand:+ start:2393 stop:3523 length:1131 start_codon:yes stop_codon:yes gene_type:complete